MRNNTPIIPILHILPETLLALFTGKRHLGRLLKCVIGGFGMAFGTVKPTLTAGAADGNLGVEDMLATSSRGLNVRSQNGIKRWER